MSLLDRDDVPAAQSRPSNRATLSPRVTASRATPAPTTPPPITTTSSSSRGAASRAACRSAGPRRLVVANGPTVVSRIEVRTAFRCRGGTYDHHRRCGAGRPDGTSATGGYPRGGSTCGSPPTRRTTYDGSAARPGPAARAAARRSGRHGGRCRLLVRRGLSGPADEPRASATASPSGTADDRVAPEPRLARFYGQQLAWHGCSGGFECARLDGPGRLRRAGRRDAADGGQPAALLGRAPRIAAGEPRRAWRIGAAVRALGQERCEPGRPEALRRRRVRPPRRRREPSDRLPHRQAARRLPRPGRHAGLRRRGGCTAAAGRAAGRRLRARRPGAGAAHGHAGRGPGHGRPARRPR